MYFMHPLSLSLISYSLHSMNTSTGAFQNLSNLLLPESHLCEFRVLRHSCLILCKYPNSKVFPAAPFVFHNNELVTVSK